MDAWVAIQVGELRVRWTVFIALIGDQFLLDLAFLLAHHVYVCVCVEGWEGSLIGDNLLPVDDEGNYKGNRRLGRWILVSGSVWIPMRGNQAQVPILHLHLHLHLHIYQSGIQISHQSPVT